MKSPFEQFACDAPEFAEPLSLPIAVKPRAGCPRTFYVRNVPDDWSESDVRMEAIDSLPQPGTTHVVRGRECRCKALSFTECGSGVWKALVTWEPITPPAE